MVTDGVAVTAVDAESPCGGSGSASAVAGARLSDGSLTATGAGTAVLELGDVAVRGAAVRAGAFFVGSLATFEGTTGGASTGNGAAATVATLGGEAIGCGSGATPAIGSRPAAVGSLGTSAGAIGRLGKATAAATMTAAMPARTTARQGVGARRRTGGGGVASVEAAAFDPPRIGGGIVGTAVVAGTGAGSVETTPRSPSVAGAGAEATTGADISAISGTAGPAAGDADV